jgi:2-amino-4-hydroxy-6-hydroxymethyldihydropteridine diphosphokinase
MKELLVIGVGGNVGTEAELIERFRAVRELLRFLDEKTGNWDLRSAPLYRTAPVGPAQPAFLNTAVQIASDEPPDELIRGLLEIERQHGRTRDGERFGPRTIDLDVLVWGKRVVRTSMLEVPHPRLHARRFALEPLVALVGEDFDVPGYGLVGELLDRTRAQAVEKLAAIW